MQTNCYPENRPLIRCSQRLLVALVIGLFLGASGSSTSAQSLSFGGDIYLGDKSAVLEGGSSRNAFIAGFSATLVSDVAGDAHLAGFSVDVSAPVSGDLYAAGSNVVLGDSVGGDVTASGFTVKLDEAASIDGNARLASGTLSIAAPIKGALLATAGTLRLDSMIDGDARISAGEITFGTNARVAGMLTYSAPEEMHIPETVAPSSRIRFVPISRASMMEDIGEVVGEPMQNFWPSFVSGLSAAVLVLAFLLVISALLFAFAPQLIESMRRRASEHGWFTLIFGFIGLSLLFGALPVSLLTIVGIPLVPIVLLFVVVFWTLGYLLGIYVLGTRVWRAFDTNVESLASKLIVMLVGLVIAAALNFIPVAGWLVNLVILFLGVGAITIVLLDALVRRTQPVLSTNHETAST